MSGRGCVFYTDFKKILPKTHCKPHTKVLQLKRVYPINPKEATMREIWQAVNEYFGRHRVNSGYAQSNQLLTDQELAAIIPGIITKLKICKAVYWACSIAGIVLFLLLQVTSNYWLFALVLALVLVISWGYAAGKTFDTRLKNLMSTNILRGVFTDAFESFEHTPLGHIPPNDIHNAGLIKDWNRISGSDFISGVHRGVNFCFSDVHLERRDDSGDSTTYITVFKGQWLILELAKEIPWRLQLRERGSGDYTKSSIETENIAFNKKFQILTADPHTAFYVLTPHFMEYILSADKRAAAKTYINIKGKEIQIALHSNRDLFEAVGKKKFDTSNIPILREQMTWDVNYIKGIIDEFLLCGELFGAQS